VRNQHHSSDYRVLSLKNPMNDRRIVISFILLLALSMFAFGQTRNSSPKTEKARDPVCGIMVEKDPQLAADYKGKTYYFCSKADRDKFKKEPDKYVRGK
jgi:YHS domain-containing protein